MSTLSFKWKVDQVSLTTDFCSRRNVKKPVLFPRYRGIVSSTDTVLAYAGTRQITPTSNIKILHLEDSIIENSRNSLTVETQFSSSSYNSPSKYFVLTDVVGDYVAEKTTPLYYKHILPSADIEPDSVTIIDGDLNEVDPNSYEVVRVLAHDPTTEEEIPGSYEECAVYSNYKNSLVESTGETTLYFVRYEVSSQTHYQLLNQQPAYSEATYDDVSPITGRMKHWRRVYILSPGFSFYSVNLPVSGDYFIKALETGRIILREPVPTDDTIPWFLNISNGAFSSLRNGDVYSYSIPEYENQSFSPLMPYKGAFEEESIFVRPDVIKVSHQDLKVDSSLYEMEILVKDYSGNTLYALTTNTSKNGDTYYEGDQIVVRTTGTSPVNVTWDSEGILGWDVNSGFIHLRDEYPDTYTVYVSYYYLETGYDLFSLNVNPVFDEEYNNQFYVVYIVPTGGDNGNLGTQVSSIQWLKVDRSGRIVDVSQDSSTGNFDLSAEYNTDGEYSYYTKSASTTTNGPNLPGQTFIEVLDTSSFPLRGIAVWTDSLGNRTVAGYAGNTATRINLVSHVLLNSITPGDTVKLHSFTDLFSSGGTNNYQWFILGESHVSNAPRVKDLSLIDLRVHGGVIKESKYRDATRIDPRAVWARPEVVSGMGQITPGDSVAVVKIPYTILKDYGGDFDKATVEQIVTTRHLAVGIIPVIIWDGAIPEITSITPGTNSLTISWGSEGLGYTYNVYYSTLNNGPWNLATLSPLVDNAYGNIYSLSGLNAGQIYYVAVTSINSDGIESPKSVVWGARVRN